MCGVIISEARHSLGDSSGSRRSIRATSWKAEPVVEGRPLPALSGPLVPAEHKRKNYRGQPTRPYACKAYEARVTKSSKARFWVAGYSNAR